MKVINKAKMEKMEKMENLKLGMAAELARVKDAAAKAAKETSALLEKRMYSFSTPKNCLCLFPYWAQSILCAPVVVFLRFQQR